MTTKTREERARDLAARLKGYKVAELRDLARVVGDLFGEEIDATGLKREIVSTLSNHMSQLDPGEIEDLFDAHMTGDAPADEPVEEPEARESVEEEPDEEEPDEEEPGEALVMLAAAVSALIGEEVEPVEAAIRYEVEVIRELAPEEIASLLEEHGEAMRSLGFAERKQVVEVVEVEVAPSRKPEDDEAFFAEIPRGFDDKLEAIVVHVSSPRLAALGVRGGQLLVNPSPRVGALAKRVQHEVLTIDEARRALYAGRCNLCRRHSRI